MPITSGEGRPPPERRARSLRSALLLFLFPVSMAGLLTAGTLAYLLSKGPAEDAYDNSLYNAAIAIGGQIHLREDGSRVLDIPVTAERMLRTRQVDTLFFQVRGPGGELLGGESTFPPAPPGALQDEARNARIYTAEYRSLPVHAMVIEYPCGSGACEVTVAETTRKRERLERRIVAGTVLPLIALELLLLGLIWFGIDRGLFPLSRLSRQIESRVPQDLRPIDPADVPKEARSLVDALNRLLADVAALYREHGRFLANAAHQLRTPLATIQAHTELALLRTLDAKARGELERVHRGAVRATRVAAQLLALARAESGAHVLEREDVDLAALATAMVDDWVSRSLPLDIDVGFELMPAKATCNPGLVSDAMDNLVGNALAYAGNGARVTVRTGHSSEPAEHAWFEVEDDGPGIPPSQRNLVLDRFYRLPGTGGDGSGLGLSIVHEIVQAHGASLVIDAPASGRGCRARIEFPAQGPA